jgi:hypothetical protein
MSVSATAGVRASRALMGQRRPDRLLASAAR